MLLRVAGEGGGAQGARQLQCVSMEQPLSDGVVCTHKSPLPTALALPSGKAAPWPLLSQS